MLNHAIRHKEMVNTPSLILLASLSEIAKPCVLDIVWVQVPKPFLLWMQ